MRLLRASRPVFWAVPPILVLMGACGSDGNGPPKAPCSDANKLHAPICGTACKAACGCKGCSDGEAREIDEATYVCQANCYVFQSGPIDGGGTGGSSGAGNQDAAPDCDAIGCDEPAICGQCANACGCCNPCVEGEQKQIEDGIYQCTDGCYVQLV
jgi:hypothetical protein